MFKEMPKPNYMDSADNSKMEIYKNDEIDKPPNSCHVSAKVIGLLLYCIVFHIVDVVYDFYIAFEYFSTGKYFYFSWTLVCLVGSSIIITLISVRMYLKDIEDGLSTKYAIVRISLCLIGTPFQSAPLIRYCDSLKFAVKCKKAESKCNRRKQEENYNKMLNENSDVALLRVFECYLESSFQLVIQITLLLIDYSYGSILSLIPKCILIGLNFIGIGCCMATYLDCIRYDQSNKKNISAIGGSVIFFWHLNFTVSRILALAALASMWPLWTCVALVAHWSVMTVWIALTNKTNFCGRKLIFEVLFSGAVGLIYIFNFISLKDGPTRKSYTIFYSLCFAENLFVSTIWGVKSFLPIKNWVYYIFATFPILTFIIGMIFLGIYYKFLHPNKTSPKD